jgi:hypothetical protein
MKLTSNFFELVLEFPILLGTFQVSSITFVAYEGFQLVTNAVNEIPRSHRPETAKEPSFSVSILSNSNISYP